MLERLQVFEIDHPATQAFKRDRIAGLGWEIPAQLHLVSLDFTKEDLDKILKRPPYDPRALTFFSWLGVTYYLSRETVFDTLSAVARISPRGSMIVFDYLDPDVPGTGKAAERVKAVMDSLQSLGEPLKTGFDPSTLESDLARIGLACRKTLPPQTSSNGTSRGAPTAIVPRNIYISLWLWRNKEKHHTSLEFWKAQVK